MFDRQFFGAILPEHVRTMASAEPERAPVVQLALAGGLTLDLCHIVRLADGWVAVAHYCREGEWEEHEVAFIPYGTIARVTLAMRSREEREIGFRVDEQPIETPPQGAPAGILTPQHGQPLARGE